MGTARRVLKICGLTIACRKQHRGARIAERHEASHILRDPLRVVQGSSAQLKQDYCEKEVERDCDHGY